MYSGDIPSFTIYDEHGQPLKVIGEITAATDLDIPEEVQDFAKFHKIADSLKGTIVIIDGPGHMAVIRQIIEAARRQEEIEAAILKSFEAQVFTDQLKAIEAVDLHSFIQEYDRLKELPRLPGRENRKAKRQGFRDISRPWLPQYKGGDGRNVRK